MDTKTLKAALLAEPPQTSKAEYIIKLPSGKEIPVRVESPTMKVWGQIANRGTNEEGEQDVMATTIWGVILLCKNPETGENIFNMTDYPALENMPFSGWFAELSKHVSNIFNAEDVDEKVGNESETTQPTEATSE